VDCCGSIAAAIRIAVFMPITLFPFGPPGSRFFPGKELLYGILPLSLDLEGVGQHGLASSARPLP
jgi:hypothetical protein